MFENTIERPTSEMFGEQSLSTHLPRLARSSPSALSSLSTSPSVPIDVAWPNIDGL